jgi:hypothetical protein
VINFGPDQIGRPVFKWSKKIDQARSFYHEEIFYDPLCLKQFSFVRKIAFVQFYNGKNVDMTMTVPTLTKNWRHAVPTL